MFRFRQSYHITKTKYQHLWSKRNLITQVVFRRLLFCSYFSSGNAALDLSKYLAYTIHPW